MISKNIKSKYKQVFNGGEKVIWNKLSDDIIRFSSIETKIVKENNRLKDHLCF